MLVFEFRHEATLGTTTICPVQAMLERTEFAFSSPKQPWLSGAVERRGNHVHGGACIWNTPLLQEYKL
jgi:hypothetical protein